jgi:hypothetical protein
MLSFKQRDRLRESEHKVPMYLLSFFTLTNPGSVLKNLGT